MQRDAKYFLDKTNDRKHLSLPVLEDSHFNFVIDWVDSASSLGYYTVDFILTKEHDVNMLLISRLLSLGFGVKPKTREDMGFVKCNTVVIDWSK
jgi:hypothetical protein